MSTGRGDSSEKWLLRQPAAQLCTFRRPGRIARGEEAFADLLPDQERYGVHFVDATLWRSARARRRRTEGLRDASGRGVETGPAERVWAGTAAGVDP